MISLMSGKSLNRQTNELGRKLLKKLIDDEFGGNQSRAAKAFDYKQGSLSDFLSGKRGAGPKLIQGVARISPEISQILTGTAVTEPDRRAIDAHVLLGANRIAATKAVEYLRATPSKLSSVRDWFDAIDTMLSAGPHASTSLAGRPVQLDYRPDPKYPARGLAVHFARLWGAPEDRIRRVQLRSDLGVDPGIEFWINELRPAQGESSTPAPPTTGSSGSLRRKRLKG